MKILILIILFFIGNKLIAQTQLDSILFNKINEYRVSNGVGKIIWSNDVFNMSNHHTSYLNLLNSDSTKTIAGHEENIDLESFEECTFQDRFKRYINDKPHSISENVASIELKKKHTDAELAEMIFKQWKESPPHNETMLTPNVKFGACSVVINPKTFISKYTSKNYGTITLPPFKKGFATFNVYD
jgi:uncharacterized protein YkwD